MDERLLKLIAIVWACISLITFIVYAVDKSRAKKRQWRIPEATLLCCSIFGGAVGGGLAMLLVRHKTKHWYFRWVNFFFALAHIAGFLYLWLVL